MINQRGVPLTADKPFVAVPPAAVPVPPAPRNWTKIILTLAGGLIVLAGLAVFGLTILSMLICH